MTVSAATGDGLDDLIAAIVRRFVPEPPPCGAGVPFREEQVDALHQIKASLLAGDCGKAMTQLSGMLERR